MATFSKRNGRITATVRIKPHPSKSKTFDTMRDAKAWAKEVEVQLSNEREGSYPHVLLKDALVEYRDTISITKKGAKQEIDRINLFIKKMKTDISLSSVDERYLISWRELRLESVSGATVRRELLLLSAIFSWCVEVKLWLKIQPVKPIKLPKASNHRERVISQYEIDRMGEFLNEELNTIFCLALETGMRLSEICGLAWNRIILDKSFLYLNSTKNGRAREVPLSVKARELLISRKGFDSAKVFNYSPYLASYDFMKARLEAEIFDITFHDSRHTAATRIAQKLQLLDLCKMFGWTDPKKAMIYYNPTSSEIASRL